MARQKGSGEATPVFSRFDIVLLLVTNVGFVVGYHAVGGILAYRAGRYNEAEPFIIGGVAAIVSIAAFCTMVVRVVWALVRWRRSRTSAKILRLGAIAVTIGFVALLRTLPCPEGYLDGLRDYVLARTSVAEIREWADAHPDFRGRAKVCGLREAYVWVTPDGQEMHIQWGGGFSTSRSLSVRPPGERPQVGHVVEIGPGAYVMSTAN